MNVDDETLHSGLAAVAVVVLGVVVALTAVFAGHELQIVLYSAVYVGGVAAFWLGYWFLRNRAGDRRRELLESEG